jgi:hypothetical protein
MPVDSPAPARHRLVSVLIAMSLAVAGCSASGSGHPGPSAPAAGSVRVVPVAGQLGGAFTAASLPAAEQVLAADGVATVADETATTALSPVTGPVRMRFTQAQVRAMALQAADGGGITGATLDAATNLPAHYPPFSYLLAAWVSATNTPAALAMRTLMGHQDWTHAPQVVFPTIALSLFVADVIAASPAPAGSSSGGSASNSGFEYRTGGGALTVESAAFLPAGFFSAPCSTVSNFIQGVLGSVFSALQLNAPSGSGVGATVGGFFVGIWNGALSLAQQAIQGLIKAVTGPILNAIKTAAATVAVISQIAAYLNPWSVKVTADPATLDAGGDGAFTGTVDAGPGGTDYPSAITDCAGSGALNITLPPLTAANADATWDLTGPITADAATTVTLDDQGTSTLPVAAAQPAADSDSCGGSDPGSEDTSGSIGVGRITVTRPGVDSLRQLVNAMLTNGLGVAGSVVGPIVQSVLAPMLDGVLGQLAGITRVIGAGTVTVNTPTPAASCSSSPTPTAGAQSTACIVGTWTTTDWTNSYLPDERGLAGVKWTLTSNGAWTGQFDGSTPLSDVGGSKVATYTGTSTATVQLPDDSTATSGTWKMTGITGTITGTFSDGGVKAYPYSTWGWAPETGTWSCQGNAMSVTYAESTGSTATVTLTRIGS